MFHKKVTDEEIAFIAIHLYSALVGIHKDTGVRKVLVISSVRQSESILLKQTLLNWASDITADFDFKHEKMVTDEDLNNYEIFLTTEKNRFYDMGLAFYIDPFPTKQDFINLKLAIDGFQSLEDITSIFYEDLYQVRTEKDRESLVVDMCNMVTDRFNLDKTEFHDAVFQRENMRSTYWGNAIAVPHPMSAVSPISFVAVTVLPKATVWDAQKNKVNLVLMVCIGKNSQKAFQLWNYLSGVFTDKHFVERLLLDPSYDHFISLLKEAIASNFSK